MSMYACLSLVCLCMGEYEQQQVYCPVVGATDANSSMQSNEFSEISGLAISPSQVSPTTGAAVMFAINDSGGGPRLGLLDSATGAKLLTLRIPTSNRDWESMSIGSCGITDMSKTCLYIADTGDNRARLSGGDSSRRESRYNIVRIEEPLLKDFVDDERIPDSYVSNLIFSYQSESSPTNSADCEATFLDNAGWGKDGAIGDLYLVTKWDESDARTKTRLFKIPTKVWLNTTETYNPEAVGSYDEGGDLMGITWTGAESSFDGTLISLVGYKERERRTTNYMFLRCPGSSVADSLAAPNGTTEHCLSWKAPDGKLEALAWGPNGMRIVNIPEGINENIGITSFVYDSMNVSQTCSEDPNATMQQQEPSPESTEAIGTSLSSTQEPPPMYTTQEPQETTDDENSEALSEDLNTTVADAGTGDSNSVPTYAYAIIGVAAAIVVTGLVAVFSKRCKRNNEAKEITKAVPVGDFETAQASYTPAIENSVVAESVSHYETFEIDSEEDDEFAC